ncbi:PREDICTED: [Prunus dulcis]|uniref:PREDICTED n=1 Tax=Prunus dulcis TaxID=3755 RepID=A0A5E4GE61_PRUDU|nr:PREDICTED: [Prunus dulcis]
MAGAPPTQRMSCCDQVQKRKEEKGCFHSCLFAFFCCCCCYKTCEPCLNGVCCCCP